MLNGQDRQACSPLIQLFFVFASDIDQTNINRDIRDGDWLSVSTAHPPLRGDFSPLADVLETLLYLLRARLSNVGTAME